MVLRAQIATLPLLLGCAIAQNGAIDLLVGETLFVGGTRLSTSWLQERARIEQPTSGDREQRDMLVMGVMHSLRRGTDATLLLPVVSVRGVLADGVTLPVVSMRGGLADGMTTVDVDDVEVGDLSLTVRQNVHHKTWHQGAWATSVLGGLQLPTGKDDARVNDVLMPPGLQAGSGSFDPHVAVASTLEFDRLRFDGSAFWSIPGEGSQDYQQGDLVSLALTAGYRVLMSQYPGPTLSLKTGLRWRSEQRARLGGVALQETGGELLSVQFGATYHPAPQWDMVVTLELPLVEDLHNPRIETDYRLLVGLGWRF